MSDIAGANAGSRSVGESAARVSVRRRRLALAAAVLLLVFGAPLAAAGWKVGSATSPMIADDSMVIGGGIGGGYVQGQEGNLQATAIVIHGDTRVCVVGIDVLMMNRDYLDEAARTIERECGIPFDNILINASHTHHAPSTVTIHGYERDEEFCRRTVSAITDAVRRANGLAEASPECTPRFRLGQEATVGQNSRQLLKDGKIYWIGPRDDFVRPTDPFDVDLPVIAFQRPDRSYAGLIFNHSTHCIGTRTGRRSPGFYGLAAQELEQDLGAPVAFLSGAAGSTHNLVLDCDEMVIRIKGAVLQALQHSEPMESNRLRAIRREFTYTIRTFDEDTEEEAVSSYCRKYVPDHADPIIQVFRDSRETLRPQQGEQRRGWLQVMQIGDVYLVAVPAEYFTRLGLEIKRRSPFRNTFVCGLTNDYVGYLPTREGFTAGGYQTWAGLHSFAEPGTGEMLVEESLTLLRELQ